MQPMKKIHVLIVDDDKAQRELYKAWLSDFHDYEYCFFEAEGGVEGNKLYATHHPDCVLLDFLMKDKDGFEFLLHLRKLYTAISPVIFITGYGNPDIREDAVGLGAKLTLDKNKMNSETLHQAILEVVAG